MNDEKKKYSKDIDIKAVKVGDGDSAKQIKDAKLKSHGIIAKDKDGKLVTIVDGHSYGKTKVEEVIKQLLPAKDDKKKKKDSDKKKAA